MKPRGLDKLLKAVSHELRDLGPFERRRALAQIRQDVVELAADGMAGWPDTEDVRGALRSMPDPEDLARGYLVSSQPPKRTIRVSLAANALLGLPPAAAGLILLGFASSALWVHPLFVAGLIGLLAVGVMDMTVYGLSLISPSHGMRWRFAVLPPATICIVFDSVLSVAVLVVPSPITVFGFGLAFLALYGGAYSISYAHGQLPRIVPEGYVPRPKKDYFRALDRQLRDLDVVSRARIQAELQDHVREEGLEIDQLSATENYAAVERVLGPPEDVAREYLRNHDWTLSRRQKAQLAMVAIPAIPGILIGAVLLLSITLYPSGEQYPTPLALMASLAVPLVSLTVLGYGLRMWRAPPKLPDHLLPATALSLAIALLVAGTVAGAASGGLARPYHPLTYGILGASPGEDRDLGVLWVSAECTDGVFGCTPRTAGDAHLSVVDLDSDRVTTTTVLERGTGSLLDFRNTGHESWMLLFSESLVTWSGKSESEFDLRAPPAWGYAAGRIGNGTASVAWVSYLPTAHTGTITFQTWGRPGPLWSRDFVIPDGNVSQILVAEDAALVLGESNYEKPNSLQSSIGALLYDASGVLLANRTLIQQNITWSGARQPGDYESLYIAEAQAGPDAFWVLVRGAVSQNGSLVEESWLALLDAKDGSAALWRLGRDEVPTPHEPSEPGDREIWHHENLLATPEGAVVSSVWMRNLRTMTGIASEAEHYYVSRASKTGEFVYRVRLDGPSGEGIPVAPVLSAWREEPIALILRFENGLDGATRLFTYTLSGTAPAVETDEFPLDVTSATGICNTYAGGRTVLSTQPGVADVAGVSVAEDRGFLGWRSGTTGSHYGYYVEVPALLRIDTAEGRTSLVPLAAPQFRPDTVAGLLATGLATAASVILLHFAHRAWRLRRSRR